MRIQILNARRAYCALVLLLSVLTAPLPAAAQQDGDMEAVQRVEQAIVEFLGRPSPDFDAFRTAWLTADASSMAGVDAGLRRIHERVHGRGIGDVMLSAEPRLSFAMVGPGGDDWLHAQLESARPFRIVNLWIEGGPALIDTEATRASTPRLGPVTWDNVAARMTEAESMGFAGALHLVRDGAVAVHDAYGMANREKNIANRTDTIFAIGSAPIDFTLAGILLLHEEGKLSLDDPVTTYFDHVPADKQSITIEHLMTGRSGLQNFHDRPGDRDPDHSWISRDEAMKRIFEGELLFAPGTGREHSHSAWGVLAAIIEIVSGDSYQDFTRTRIYEPLGMTDTGFHGDALPEARTAVGYGPRRDGAVNAPPWWGEPGRTSWLVLGSGGQVSTIADMARFIESIHSGALLSAESTRWFKRLSRGLLNGGNAYGFEIYYSYTPDTFLVLVSNVVDANTRRLVGGLARQLGDLVLDSTRPAFTLGVGMELSPGRILLTQVVPGGGADQSGLRVGDVVVSIAGAVVGDDPLDQVDPYLRSGESFAVIVERDGERLELEVTPRRRGT